MQLSLSNKWVRKNAEQSLAQDQDGDDCLAGRETVPKQILDRKLVAQLRQVAHAESRSPYSNAPLLSAAAAAIERLLAENERLEAARERLSPGC